MNEDLESSVSINTKRRLSKYRKKQDDYCPFDIPGVTKLKLSPITQNVIGCVVGDQVSAESPWTFVKKEKIEKNIEYNEEESEFFLLKEKIQEYGESDIYVGWLPAVSEIEDFFYIVFTIDAKDIVERIIQRQKAELQRRVDKLIYRPIGEWKSLGSENEVDGYLVKDFRPLYVVNLQIPHPFREIRVSLKLKRVEEIENGYVELLPEERLKTEIVARRRVDFAIQAAPKQISQDAQTTSTYPTNIWTQYTYKYVRPKLEDDAPTEEQQEQLARRKQPKVKKVYPIFNTEYMMATVKELGEHIKVNNFFNIYQDDYANLVLSRRIPTNSSDNITLFASFSDQLCTSKLISCCTWNPFRSGIIAVAYSKTTLNLFTANPNVSDEVHETIFGHYPIIIWSYSETILPKLYLEAPRQITSLSFCPYEKDILVGGCENGQIIIWNLREKLAENVESLIPQHENYRLGILDILNWNRGIFAKNMTQGNIISSVRVSQKHMITSINWMPSNVEISSEGKFNYNCERSKQFLTCSLDGTISFWDIDSRMKIPSARRKKINQDILKISKSKRDKTLHKKQMKIEKLGAPIYTLNINEKVNFSVTSMLELYDEPMYRPTDTNLNSAREYEISEFQNKVDEMNFLFTSSFGKIVKVDIVQPQLDEYGLEIEDIDKIIFKRYAEVHDGPIIYCQSHPMFRENILTIGGNIFAIWNIKILEPILWNRSSNHKYISGGWAEKNPSFFILVCSDGSCELWDLLNTKHCPVKSIYFGDIMSLFGTTSWSHCREGTIAVSYKTGVLKVYKMPEILRLFNEQKLLKTKIYFEKAIESRNQLKLWMDNFEKNKKITGKKNSFKERVLKSGRLSRLSRTSKSASTRLSEIERMDRIFAGVKWETLEHEESFKTMLELKNVNLSDLEEFRQPLQKKVLEKRDREHKIQNMLANKQKNIKNSEADVLFKVDFGKERRFSLPSIENSESFCHVDDYEEIEKRSLNFIKCNEYKPEFSFVDMIDKARKIRQRRDILLKNVNVRERKKN